MKKIIFAMTLLSLVCIYGCISREEIRGLKTLSRYSKSQEGNEKFVEVQEEKFENLLDDYKNDRLKKGLSQRYIFRNYGEPVSSRMVEDDPLIKERLVYRYPMEFFGSEKMYLFFDEDKKLIDWRWEEASIQEQE